jgi:hypothetical protein
VFRANGISGCGINPPAYYGRWLRAALGRAIVRSAGVLEMRLARLRAAATACRQAFAIITAIALLLAAAGLAAPARAQSTSLVGTYDGGQMEMAAGLELQASGRFRYALSYGALDEQAAGRWTSSGGAVLLTSDPVTAPRFILVSRGKGPDGVLQLSLDVPKGVSRQYFSVEIRKANGETQRQQLGEDGLSAPFSRNNPPTGIRMLFPVFSVVDEPIVLDPNAGYSVRFRFEPNDIGKVDFRGTPLRIIGGDLVLDRHGRTIRFRRTRG